MLLRKVLSILCFLTSVSFVVELDALKAGDEGVCVVKLSSPRTRVRYFTAYGKCNKKKCIVKKSKKEKYFVVTNQTVCCKGWEYSSAEEKCSPHCSTGCSGGRCVAPDTCQCEPPAQLDPEHGNTCITLCNPACHPPAVCQNHSCICDPGRTYNSTHCIPLCQPGFSNNPVSLACEPTCDPPCINGNCTAPNTCSCPDGTQLKEDGVTCKPTCERCVGRDCADACACKDGYVKHDGACVPSCASCEHGRCVSPDICECDAGFTRVGDVCAPVCEGGCVNADCSAPGVCTCWEGFQRNETRPRECYKSCADCAGCTSRGECVQDEACRRNDDDAIRSRLKNSNKDTESARTRIACCAGWRYDAASASCQPQCRFGCSGGRCVAPDTCHCAPPLRLRAGACEPPACRQPCVHAACTDTDTCSCHPDHTPYNATHCAPLCPDGHYNDPTTLSCLPICDERCVNARCSAPNTCTCLDGYVFKDNNTCVPECKQPCENADCVAPDTCLCRQGYVNETEWKCTPQCQSCVNGDCVAPNSCRCHEGYTRVDNVCQPLCDRNCSNGVCSAPNFCTCNDGFKLDPSDNLSCVPQCEPPCVNATCSAPNICSCLSGYHKTESHWSCEPHCDGCNNGDCIAPNTCLCHTGYSKDVDGKCVPECDADCSNGYCSEPNLCTCHLGYEKRNSDPFQCHPICYPSCVNATCVAPNTCTCFDGYESTDNSSICKPKCAACNNGQCVGPDECSCNKGYTLIDGTCTPVCEDKCINGICSAPGICSCLPGYSKNETNDNECYRPCKSCEMGTCTTGGVCICNTGFFFENDTCVSVTPIECSSCAGNCSGSPCWCPDGRPCYSLAESREMSTSPRDIATITWVFGATLGVLMVSLVCVIHWMWRRQKRNEKPSNNGDLYNSVIYTVPDTLMKRNLYGETDISAKMAEEEDQRSVEDVTEEQWPSERLLTSIEAQNNIA